MRDVSEYHVTPGWLDDKAKMAAFFGMEDKMLEDVSLLTFLRVQISDYTAELRRRNELSRHEDVALELHRMLDRMQLAGKIAGLRYVVAILENRDDTSAGRERRHKYVAL